MTAGSARIPVPYTDDTSSVKRIALAAALAVGIHSRPGARQAYLENIISDTRRLLAAHGVATTCGPYPHPIINTPTTNGPQNAAQ